MNVLLWCLLFVVAVWVSCLLIPVVGNWVFVIPGLAILGYFGLLEMHRRRWLTRDRRP